ENIVIKAENVAVVVLATTPAAPVANIRPLRHPHRRQAAHFFRHLAVASIDIQFVQLSRNRLHHAPQYIGAPWDSGHAADRFLDTHMSPYRLVCRTSSSNFSASASKVSVS